MNRSDRYPHYVRNFDTRAHFARALNMLDIPMTEDELDEVEADFEGQWFDAVDSALDHIEEAVFYRVVDTVIEEIEDEVEALFEEEEHGTTHDRTSPYATSA